MNIKLREARRLRVLKKKNKKRTLGVLSQNRGVMPPPVRADVPKKGKGSYKRYQAKKVGVYE